MHLIYSESLQSQVFNGMFKNVQCEHRWSHGTHQAGSPILAKRVPAMRCQWLQQLSLFGPSVHPCILERASTLASPFITPHKKKSLGVRSGDLGGPGM